MKLTMSDEQQQETDDVLAVGADGKPRVRRWQHGGMVGLLFPDREYGMNAEEARPYLDGLAKHAGMELVGAEELARLHDRSRKQAWGGMWTILPSGVQLVIEGVAIPVEVVRVTHEVANDHRSPWVWEVCLGER